MTADFRIVVLCGGISSEREVSLVSGQMVRDGLEPSFPGKVTLYDLTEASVPLELDPDKDVVFPALHGTFGEDGALQALLEDLGFAYAGAGPEASQFCMDKERVRRAATTMGIAVAEGVCLSLPPIPKPKEILRITGDDLITKPRAEGSSVGLHFAEGEAELAALLPQLPPGDWLFERRLRGRELSVGVLDGQGMGVVEIIPNGGVYDYAHKYTAGLTQYQFPADIPNAMESTLRDFSGKVFSLTGCRDFARVDYILEEDQIPRLLEINTIPGLTPTSLLPKSANCVGLDYLGLVRRMVLPALQRFHVRTPIPVL